MKRELNSLWVNLKKQSIWFIILLLLLIAGILAYAFSYKDQNVVLAQYVTLICMPGQNNYYTTTQLIIVYNILLIAYFIYIYFTSEMDYVFENVILRIKEKKWLISKFVIGTLFIILLKALLFFMIYYFFKEDVAFKINYLINPIVYLVFTEFLVITIISFFKRKNYFAYAIIAVVSYYTFFNYNTWFLLTATLLLAIINFIFFKFKRYYKINY